MGREFPTIEHISDVLTHVQGCSEFVVAERDGYTIVNYNVVTPTTFPDLDDPSGAIRRECRGIVFSNDDGRILRRPLHKFFNCGERDETRPELIDLSRPHHLLDKVDGSFIAPFNNDGRIIWGTKMCAQEFHDRVADFVDDRYHDLVLDLLGHGQTPIFEWCSRSSRVVIDHPEDKLILLAVRGVHSGAYLGVEGLNTLGRSYDVPVVGSHGFRTDVGELLKETKGLTDTEGFVVRFSDGEMLKVKTDWYLQIHRARESILQDRNVVQMMLDGTVDDVRAHLPDDEKIRLATFEDQFWYMIKTKAVYLINRLVYHRSCTDDRKTFATEYASEYGWLRPIAFRLWGVSPLEYDQVRGMILDEVGKRLSTNRRYEEVRDGLLEGLRFNR